VTKNGGEAVSLILPAKNYATTFGTVLRQRGVKLEQYNQRSAQRDIKISKLPPFRQSEVDRLLKYQARPQSISAQAPCLLRLATPDQDHVPETEHSRIWLSIDIKGGYQG